MAPYTLHGIIGQCGLYQFGVFFLCSLSGFIAVFNHLGAVFLGAIPEHWCRVPELVRLNLTLDQIKNFSIPQEEKDGQNVYSSCQMYQRNYSRITREEVLGTLRGLYNGSLTEMMGCTDGWQYDQSIYMSTIVTKWDLICDRQWLLATSNSLYMGGLMAGLLLSGILADRIGWRKIMVIAGIVVTVFGISTAFSPYYWLYVFLRFVLAMGHSSMVITGFVIVTEIIGDRYRTLGMVAYGIHIALGYMTLPWVAYAIRDEFYLHLAYSIPSVIYLTYIILAPESLRWLFVKGKIKEGEEAVRRIARINKKKVPEGFTIQIKTEMAGAGILHLFRSPRLRYTFLICCFIWFACNIVVFGLLLNTSNLSGDPFLNTFIFGSTEIPELLLDAILLHFVGRKKLMCLGLLLTGAIMLLTLAVPPDDSFALYLTFLSLAGKICIIRVLAVAYIYTAELVPTAVRNVAIATATITGYLGGIVAPYFVQLGQQSRLISTITFGVVSIAGGLLALLLPETKGKDLPDTFEDLKHPDRKKDVVDMDSDV